MSLGMDLGDEYEDYVAQENGRILLDYYEHLKENYPNYAHLTLEEWIENFDKEPLSFDEWLAEESEKALWGHEELAEDRGTERE